MLSYCLIFSTSSIRAEMSRFGSQKAAAHDMQLMIRNLANVCSAGAGMLSVQST